MESAQRRLKAVLATVTSRLVREPAAWAMARDLASDFVERIPFPVCVVCESELRIEVANRAFRSLTMDEGLVGRPLRETMSGERGGLLERELVACMSTGAFRRHTVLLDPGAQRCPGERHYDWLFCPLGVLPGPIRSAAVVGYDVTTQHESLRRTQLALRSAERLQSSKDEFLAQLAHELRGPLSPIITSLDLLRRSHRDALAPEYFVIERQAKHLARLVEDVVDLGRTEFRGMALKRERVVLSSVIDRALEVSGPLLAAHRHEVQLDVAPDLLVEADPARLLQIMSNLVTNAAKYMADGGSLQITGRRVHREIVVAVLDTGIGIARDMLPYVFDRFMQAPGAERRSQDGLGLGLHIVRALVREHGGNIEAHSDGLGRGSTFTIRLPSLASIECAPASSAETREAASAADVEPS